MILIATLAFTIAGYYHAELFHFHVTKFYAHMGHPHAQHVTGQKYLHGKGVERNHTEAMAWFRRAADQGHAHAAYNLAVGRMKGMHKDTRPG
jgi:TPR repeat protein